MLYALSVVAGLLTCSIWLHLLLARGGFWRIQPALLPCRPTPETSVRVVAIIPARNEAATIAQSVMSLLKQTSRESIHVVVVDDDSSDATADVARQAARNCGTPESLTVIPGAPLPPGWSGKLWAVQQGIEKARELHPEFLLLTDADVVHSPDDVAALVAFAQRARYDLVSLMVKLHCRSMAERWLIPAFVFFFLKLYPPAWSADPHHATAAAAGGCILVRPEALDRAGRIEAIRDQIIDDCALARAIKRSGGSIWLGLATSTRSIRPYSSLSPIGNMIARTAFSQLRHSALLLIATLAGLAAVYLAPVALLFSGHALPVACGVAASAMMVLAYFPMVRFYGLSPLWALTLPGSALFYMGATVKSALDFWSGRGGEWKGRTQDSTKAAGADSKQAGA